MIKLRAAGDVDDVRYEPWRLGARRDHAVPRVLQGAWDEIDEHD